MQFAYLQPHHKDWFDVSVGQVALAGIDLSTYLSEKVLRIADVQISDAVLQNFKNQKYDTRDCSDDLYRITEGSG